MRGSSNGSLVPCPLLLRTPTHAGFNSSSKAAASRLKGGLKGSSSSMNTTPQKLRQQAQRGGEALPHTPDGKQLSAARGGGASADDGLLSLSPQLLSPNLMVLNQILGE
jgi:hypothetical protein